MVIFEQQRIATSKKNKQWRVNQVDSICSRVDEFGNDWYRMWQNYRLKNNQINQEEYREYCDTLGLSEGEGKKFVEPFNQTHNIIEVLKGEESNMPWNYDVINLSPKATNELLRQKQREIREYVDAKMEMEIERSQAKVQLAAQVKAGTLDPQKAEEEMQKINEQLQKREESILSPADIEKKYANYKSRKEITMHKLLRALSVNFNLKWVKNQTFEDALIAGLEALEVVVDDYTGLPTVRQLNPLNLFFHKSSDSPFIQDGDYVGYKEEMTISDALDKFGEDMHEKDVKKLRQYNSKIFGTSEKFSSPHGESVSHWDNLKKYEYSYRHPLSTIPSYGTTNVLSEGLYASDRYRYKFENYCVVYTVYWKSQRRVGKYTYTNEYGELADTIVDEEFVIPKRAKKKSYTPHMFSKPKTKYEWEDDDGNYNALEWIWIPEVWKGTRINGDIYTKIEPYENAYQSLLNPYKTKLPVHGFVYNSRNAFSVSTMDRMKPWQKLYYVVMSKWLKLITQDKGVVQMLNVLMLDKKLGYKEALQIAIDQGVLPYNPLQHTQGLGNVAGQMKAADRLDLSNSQQLSHYTNILQFIEQQLKQAAGISETRLAQTGRNTNVTDNQRDMAQSMNITSPVFSSHDLLWQEVLQSLCETAAKTLDGKSGFVRQVLSDDEIALIDLGLISMEDEYVVKVGNNSRAYRVLEQAKGFAQALIQNDKAKFSTLLDLLDNTNLSEFKEELRGIEQEIEQRENMMMQQQQQMQQQQLEAQKQQQQAEQQHELDKIKLKGEYDVMKAQIQAMSWNEDKDSDNDGIPDVLEIEKLRNQALTEERKLNLEEKRLELEDEKIQQKEREVRGSIEEKSQEKERDNAQRDKELASSERMKREELASKERIEKRKTNSTKKTN
jgi:hypothetical protein